MDQVGDEAAILGAYPVTRGNLISMSGTIPGGRNGIKVYNLNVTAQKMCSFINCLASRASEIT